MYYSFGIYLKKNMSELSQWRGLSKLEHLILLYDVTLLPQYNYLVNLLSESENAETVRAASDRVRQILEPHGIYNMPDEQREHFRKPESPFSLESTGWSHLPSDIGETEV